MSTVINGTTGISKVQPAVVGEPELNLAANSPAVKTALNASGNAPIYACRAWVNFNGTGTVAIRASGNVSSITDNGVGDYTVNFTAAMPDANYSSQASQNIRAGANGVCANTDGHTVNSVKVFLQNAVATYVDASIVTCSIFR